MQTDNVDVSINNYNSNILRRVNQDHLSYCVFTHKTKQIVGIV